MTMVSIIIVNFNSGDLLINCLDSIYSQTFKDFEIIIVDNSSKDQSLSIINRYPNIIKIFNKHNSGFAAGQNQGIAAANGRMILSLNFDLVMMPDFLENFIGALDEDPKAGWAACKLKNLNIDGTFADTIYAVGHELPPDRNFLLRGLGQKDEGQFDNIRYVFGSPGAAALYKREMVESICFNGQFFDESLFTWGEDIDVDWRAQNLGWKCLYVPNAVCYHLGHVHEDYQEPFRSFYAKITIRNRWLVILGDDQNPDFKALFRYEISLIFYVLRVRLNKSVYSSIIFVYKATTNRLKKKEVFNIPNFRNIKTLPSLLRNRKGV